MLGHSVGEYVAACLAGVFTLDDALRLVAARGRLMQAHAAGRDAGGGAAGRRRCGRCSATAGAVDGGGQRVRQLCVVAGPIDGDRGARRRSWQRAGSMVRRLDTSHAFHSAMMEPALDGVPRRRGARSRCGAPTMPLRLERHRHVDHRRRRRPTRTTGRGTCAQPVRFAAGVAALLRAGSARVCSKWGRAGRWRRWCASRALPGDRPDDRLDSCRIRSEATADQARAAGSAGPAVGGGRRGRLAGVTAADDSAAASRCRPIRSSASATGSMHRAVVSPWSVRRRSRARTDRGLVLRAELEATRPRWSSRPPVCQRWLVFVDEIGVASAVVDRLRQAGHDVIVVRANDTVRRSRSADFTHRLSQWRRLPHAGCCAEDLPPRARCHRALLEHGPARRGRHSKQRLQPRLPQRRVAGAGARRAESGPRDRDARRDGGRACRDGRRPGQPRRPRQSSGRAV